MTLKKVLSILLVLCMTAGFLTGVLPGSALAAGSTTTIVVGVGVADVKNAGTDSTIYLRVGFVSGGTADYKLDTAKHDDFERKSYKEYTVKIDKPAWEITKLGLNNSGSDAMCIGYVNYQVTYGSRGTVVKLSDGSSGSPLNIWIEKSNHMKTFDLERDANPYIWVKVGNTSYNSFSEFNQNLYLDSGSSGTESYAWSGYLSDQYNSYYDMYDAGNAGTLSLTVSGIGKSGSEASTKVFTDGGKSAPIRLKNPNSDESDKPTTLVVDKAKVYQQMIGLGINKLDVKVTLTLPDKTFKGTRTYSETVTIRTKTFAFDTPTISSSYYTESKDNYYFNKAYQTVTVDLPILSSGNHNNYDPQSIALYLTWDEARLYYDGTNYVTTTSKYVLRDNGVYKVQLTFSLAGVTFDNPAGASSLRLELRSPTATYRSGIESITYSSEAANNIYSHSFTTFKYDNVAPTLSVTGDGDLGGVWRRSMNVYTTVTNNNLTYPVTGASAVSEANRNTFELWLEKDRSAVPLEKGSSSGHQAVPAQANYKSTLSLKNKEEGNRYTLVVHGYDAAANEFRYTYDNIWLDNLAPRASLNTGTAATAADGSKSIQYKFTIDELSGTGKVHYCFLENGVPLPNENNESAASGTIDTLLNKWAYIDQDKASGSTIVLKVNKGECFTGKLCYYTTDACGNRSETKTLDVNLLNATAECTVNIKPFNYPLSDYSDYITFTPASGCKVYYRYASMGGQYIEYTPGASKPGSPYPNGKTYTQSDGSTTEYPPLNGNQTLEYKVVNLISGNANYFEGDNGIQLYFDNSDSDISIVSDSAALSPMFRSLTVKAADDSGIVSAEYAVSAAGSSTALRSGSLNVRNEAVNEAVSFAGLGNGCYTLTVTVYDRNGNKTEKTSDPFTLRETAPAVDAEIAADSGTQQEDGSWLLNGSGYSVNLNLSEEYAGAAEAGRQQVWYRVSGDGSTYSDWLCAGDAAQMSGGFALDTTLNAPLALTDGDNLLYLQFLFADQSKSLTNVTLANTAIAVLDPIRFHVDTEAPDYQLEITTPGKTNEAVTAILTLFDNDAGALTLSSPNEGSGLVWTNEPPAAVVTDETGAVVSGTEETEAAPAESVWYLTITQRDVTMKVTDAAGNVTNIPLDTSLLDFGPPDVTGFTCSATNLGESRTDADVYFTVNDAVAALTDIRLICTSGENAGMQFMPGKNYTLSVAESKQNGETEKTKYHAVVKGINGTFQFLISAEDEVGNPLTDWASPAFTVSYPTEFEIVGHDDQEKAVTTARSRLYFNVPVFVLPQDLMTADAEKDAELAASMAADYFSTHAAESSAYAIGDDVSVTYPVDAILTYETDTPAAHTFDLVVADEFGNTGSLRFTPATTFGEGYRLEWELEQWFVDESGNWTKLTGDALPLQDAYFVGSIAGTYYRYDPPRYETVLRIRGANPDDRLLFDLYDFDSLANLDFNWLLWPEDGETGTPCSTESAYEGKYSEAVLRFDPLLSEPDRLYSRIINLTLDCCLTEDCEQNAVSGSEILYQTNYFSFDNVLRALPGYDLVFSPADRTAKEVQLVAVGISRDVKTVTDSEGNMIQEPVEITEIALYRKTYSDEGPVTELLARTVASEDGTAPVLDYTFTDNTWDGMYEIIVTDEFGRTGGHPYEYEDDHFGELITGYEVERGIVVRNIFTGDPLSDMDYTVAYDLGADGTVDETYSAADAEEKFTDWVSGMTDWLQEVRVTLAPVVTEEPTVSDSGRPSDEVPVWSDEPEAGPDGSEEPEAGLVYRGLTVLNNGGSFNVTLTANNPSFTFLLQDRYGFTYEQEVHYNYFDVTAPTLSTALSTTLKTNQPVTLTVTANDTQSGIASVSVAKAGASGAALTANTDGTFTITENGSYSVTVLDHAGNKRTGSVTVSNIDTTDPKLSYVLNTAALTQDPVIATLSFDEANVEILSVEASDQYPNLKYSFSRIGSTITFEDNGSVDVTFRDAAGNEVTDIVSITNFFSNPPALVAVPVLADDELSVSVTFEMATTDDGLGGQRPVDAFRQLSDLNVSCNGQILRAETDGQKAVFRLMKNGDYTFKIYDDYGLTQYVELTVSDIDTAAPKVVAVSWHYTYLDESGAERNLTETVPNPAGAGYRIAADRYPRTNGAVEVTVTTDQETAYVGGLADASIDHTLIYRENGMYIFNLAKKNGLSANFGVDVEVIDTTPPVITAGDGSLLGELVFVEGSKNYTRALLDDCIAADAFGNIVTKVPVTIDYGGFDPTDLDANKFDKSEPYFITYRAVDEAGNVTELTRKVTLVAYDDVLVTVNGELPDSGGSFADYTGDVRLELVNYAGGTAYAKHMTGYYTLGQMKTQGEQLTRSADGSFELKGLTNGWHSFYIQTATRDYFLITVFVSK